MRSLSYILTALAILVLSACSAIAPVPTATTAPTPIALPPTATPEPAPAPSPTPGLAEGLFFLESARGKEFSGKLYGHGETVVVLANQGSNDTYRWDPLVAALVENGFTVVTFQYSYSAEDFAIGSNDLGRVMDHLVKDGGYKRLVCIGGSLGTVACAAKKNRPEIIGMVILANPSGIDLSEATFPKLFITGDTDPCCALATEFAYKGAAEPKAYKSYPTGAHAVTLFSTIYADEITEVIVQFVKELP